MDWEAPVDGWYVWLGVALVSVWLAAFALGLPSQPPPDATRAANTIDRVSSSSHQAEAAYEHDAREVKIDTKQVWMRNDGGTTQESIAFGSLTPVHAVENHDKREALDRIMYGQHPRAVLDDYSFGATALLDEAEDTRTRIDQLGAEWRPAEGVLRVRKIEIEEETLVLVDA
jgi:hypothetical protein